MLYPDAQPQGKSGRSGTPAKPKKRPRANRHVAVPGDFLSPAPATPPKPAPTPQPVKKAPDRGKPKYTLAEQIRRRNQERARQDAAAQKRRPSIPTVIYTAFDKHRADEHQERIKERQTASSAPSLSGFPQDIEWQPDISQADVFDICDRLCEENPEAMTAMMNFIEGSDSDDDEQTIRRRVNNHLRILGLNDAFDRGDWYTPRLSPAMLLLTSPSSQNDTIDMAFATNNTDILQLNTPGNEAEIESQRINLVSLEGVVKVNDIRN